MYQESDYEKFAAMMEEKYPSMFEGSYGGFAIGPGWWPIVESLCAHIQSHVVQSNERRKLLLESNPYNTPIPDEVPPVVVEQIKEKFGTLRFYSYGGDRVTDGMVDMAETMSSMTCETCGKLGKMRGKSWFYTACDEHTKPEDKEDEG